MPSSRAWPSSATQAQAAIDDGGADGMLLLLPEIGRLLQHAERARRREPGVPTQEVIERDGGYTLRFRRMLPVEDWNAQLSLLAGRAAAGLMLEAGVGIVRMMPPADEVDVARLRRVAEGLGLDWDRPSLHRGVDSIDPSRTDAESVFLQEAAGAVPRCLLRRVRGSAAARSDACGDRGAVRALHRAVATAGRPYANEVCLAICAGTEVPAWARDALPALPDRDGAGRRAREAARAHGRGCRRPPCSRRWSVRVRRARDRPVEAGQGEVALRRPAVIGPCDDVHELGARVRVRLEEADVAKHAIRFATVPSSTD